MVVCRLPALTQVNRHGVKLANHRVAIQMHDGTSPQRPNFGRYFCSFFFFALRHLRHPWAFQSLHVVYLNMKLRCALSSHEPYPKVFKGDPEFYLHYSLPWVRPCIICGGSSRSVRIPAPAKSNHLLSDLSQSDCPITIPYIPVVTTTPTVQFLWVVWS